MQPTYGWRVSQFSISRDGFYASVEKFWCTPEEDGWRWSTFRIGPKGDPTEPRQIISDAMPLVAAMTAAETWINEQIAAAAAADADVYFAGAEGLSAERPLPMPVPPHDPETCIDCGAGAGPVKEDR